MAYGAHETEKLMPTDCHLGVEHPQTWCCIMRGPHTLSHDLPRRSAGPLIGPVSCRVGISKASAGKLLGDSVCLHNIVVGQETALSASC